MAASNRLNLFMTLGGGTVVSRQLHGIGKGAKESGKEVELLRQGLGLLGAAFGIKSIIDINDELTSLKNRLRAAGVAGSEMKNVLSDLRDIANDTYSSLQGTAELYGRLRLAINSINIEGIHLIDTTRALQQAIKLSTSDVREAENAMIQLSQGIASNRLGGDELRSVLEQLPVVADTIAKSLGVTRGELRELGKEGKLTAQVVLDAFKDAAPELEQRFKAIKPTIGQTMTVVRNEFMLAVGEFEESTGVFRSVANALLFLAENMEYIMAVAVPLLAALTGYLIMGAIALAISKVAAAFQTLGAIIVALEMGMARTAVATMGLSTAMGAAGAIAMAYAGTLMLAYRAGEALWDWVFSGPEEKTIAYRRKVIEKEQRMLANAAVKRKSQIRQAQQELIGLQNQLYKTGTINAETFNASYKHLSRLPDVMDAIANASGMTTERFKDLAERGLHTGESLTRALVRAQPELKRMEAEAQTVIDKWTEFQRKSGLLLKLDDKETTKVMNGLDKIKDSLNDVSDEEKKYQADSAILWTAFQANIIKTKEEWEKLEQAIKKQKVSATFKKILAAQDEWNSRFESVLNKEFALEFNIAQAKADIREIGEAGQYTEAQIESMQKRMERHMRLEAAQEYLDMLRQLADGFKSLEQNLFPILAINDKFAEKQKQAAAAVKLNRISQERADYVLQAWAGTLEYCTGVLGDQAISVELATIAHKRLNEEYDQGRFGILKYANTSEQLTDALKKGTEGYASRMAELNVELMAGKLTMEEWLEKATKLREEIDLIALGAAGLSTVFKDSEGKPALGSQLPGVGDAEMAATDRERLLQERLAALDNKTMMVELSEREQYIQKEILKVEKELGTLRAYERIQFEESLGKQYDALALAKEQAELEKQRLKEQEKMLKRMRSEEEARNKAFQGIVQNLGDSLIDAALDADTAWGKFWANFMADLAAALFKLLLMQAIKEGFSSSAADAVGSVVQGFATGGTVRVPGSGPEDSSLMMARVSPGEQITFTPRTQQGGHSAGQMPAAAPVVNTKMVVVANMREAVLEAQRSPEGERVTIQHLFNNASAIKGMR